MPPSSTSLMQLLETTSPIVQAPMAGSQGSALAIAVSNAGGLGSLPCAMLTADAMRDELRAIRAGTTEPYNVNFFVHRQPVSDAQSDARWRELLAPYYAELGVDANDIPTTGGRAPFDHDAADVLEEFRPPVVSFHFGLPDDTLLARVKSWGSKVLASATTVDEAEWLDAHGVDAVIAQGVEAGGHRGMFLSSDLTTQIGTFSLVPQVAKAVAVPVIAAGGIADSDGVRAARVLGAAGAQVGTAYLLCPEATTSEIHRSALRSDTTRHTALTNLFTGRPARGIVNRFMRECGPISDVAPAFPLAGAAVMPLRARAEKQGSGDFSPLWAGQHVVTSREIPAAALTRELSE
jgi:nitronate monooxygenase